MEKTDAKGVDTPAGAARYAALKTARPDLFAGDGPVRLADRTPSATEGVVHANPWFMVVADPVTMPDGRDGTYARIVPTTDGAPVAVLPMTTDGDVVMLRHWRHATRRRHLEIPRGFGEDDTAAIRQASAELLEELGVEAVALEPLGTLHPDTGLQSAEVSLFLARLPTDAAPVHREGMAEVVVLDDAAFRAAVREGAITDPFAIAAWTRATLTAAAIRD